MTAPKELLEVYDENNDLIELQERRDFYNEIQKEFASTGKISKKVKSIRVLLMTSDGRIYLQRRSNTKEQNRGLYDKTVGGHSVSGHTWEVTLVKEMAEELGIPSVVLPTEDFSKAVESTDTSVIAIFKEIEQDNNFMSERILDTGKMMQPCITTFYVGYYDGPIKFHDGEASGIEIHSLEELEKDIAAHPEKYTHDLKVMIEKYRDHLIPVDQIQHN